MLFRSSGDYGNSKELDWNQINVGAYLGIPAETVDSDLIEEFIDVAPRLNELTSVTKKTRRIFTLDINRLRENIEDNDPEELYLNFFAYKNYDLYGINGTYSGNSGEDILLNKYLRNDLDWLEEELRVPITMLGTGPDLNHYIDRRPYVKRMVR